MKASLLLASLTLPLMLAAGCSRPTPGEDAATAAEAAVTVAAAEADEAIAAAEAAADAAMAAADGAAREAESALDPSASTAPKDSTIQITFSKEPYRPDVYEGANHGDPHKAALPLSMKNTSTRDVSAFEGVLLFNDVFGKTVYRMGFSNDKTIKAGKSFSGVVVIQTLGDEHAERLYTSDYTKMKIVLVPEKIIFLDGGTWDPVNGLVAAIP